MTTPEDNVKRARRRMLEAYRRRQERLCMKALAAIGMALAAIALAIACGLTGPEPMAAAAETGADNAGQGGTISCRATMSWPLEPPAGAAHPVIVEPFDAPSQPWLPGHRGVDLEARGGEPLLAPADGLISFVGEVGGKDVVSVSHGTLVSTFEPARTELAVGAAVERGRPFARVGGRSDHCDGRCLHWGVRAAGRDYRDPTRLASNHRIVLKSAD